MTEPLKHHVWGDFPPDIKQGILDTVQNVLPTYKEGWEIFQSKITEELRQTYNSVKANIPLSSLGVSGVKAEIDICFKDKGDKGFLVHISGRKMPKHEKELLEIIAVALCNGDFRYGALIMRYDNKLNLEGKRSSYAYCTGALLRLMNPILNISPLKGLLFIGYAAPI